MPDPNRRDCLVLAATLLATGAARTSAAAEPRRFAPEPGAWRQFEVTTRVEILDPAGTTRVWLPLAGVDTDYQQSLGHSWSGGGGDARVVVDPRFGGAPMLCARFDAGAAVPRIALTSSVRVRSRSTDWQAAPRASAVLDAEQRRQWTAPTSLLPTDGIVRHTADAAIGKVRDDAGRARRLYDWVVANTWREPKVRGCGVGDVRTMLETGNFGGKCGDINGLFVALCRSVGIPARDVYGVRVAPSAFGYRELGANPARLQAAQHCRAEVHLRGRGWVAMDPADVGKVMRQETPQWIRDPADAVVAPVAAGLFGGWEGNWMAYNTAHDVALPNSRFGPLGFLMYPQAENDNGRLDPLDPEHFRYTITAQETAA